MNPYLQTSATAGQTITDIELVARNELDPWLEKRSELERAWIKAAQFEAQSAQWCWLPDPGGAPASIVATREPQPSFATLGHLPLALPAGVYRLASTVETVELLGWGLGAYQYTRYKAANREPAQLLLEADWGHLKNVCEACGLGRDLINAAAQDMLPSHLSAVTQDVASRYGAQFKETVGDELLEAGYRTIHAVGRAADDAPRLIDLTWGNPAHPKITLVGKGVCFDSGGLDLKPAAGMRWMKKDMGGAAIALGLAQLIMAEGLPVRLRLLISAVENAVAGNAYRPGDVIETYAGISVEIDNTDAEGRLVMCDAISLACEEQPEMLFDFSTLTGSARSAVGTEISAMFATDDDTAAALYRSGQAWSDSVWRMPLHQPYEHMLRSGVADTVNSAASPYAGSVTAALFLKKFVRDTNWTHFDLMAFNNRSRPGHPEGGEAMALRAVFYHLAERYGAA